MIGILTVTALAIAGLWIVAPLLTERLLRSQAGRDVTDEPAYDWIKGP
jgi:hypothetical protein